MAFSHNIPVFSHKDPAELTLNEVDSHIAAFLNTSASDERLNDRYLYVLLDRLSREFYTPIVNDMARKVNMLPRFQGVKDIIAEEEVTIPVTNGDQLRKEYSELFTTFLIEKKLQFKFDKNTSSSKDQVQALIVTVQTNIAKFNGWIKKYTDMIESHSKPTAPDAKEEAPAKTDNPHQESKSTGKKLSRRPDLFATAVEKFLAKLNVDGPLRKSIRRWAYLSAVLLKNYKVQEILIWSLLTISAVAIFGPLGLVGLGKAVLGATATNLSAMGMGAGLSLLAGWPLWLARNLITLVAITLLAGVDNLLRIMGCNSTNNDSLSPLVIGGSQTTLLQQLGVSPQEGYSHSNDSNPVSYPYNRPPAQNPDFQDYIVMPLPSNPSYSQQDSIAHKP